MERKIFILLLLFAVSTVKAQEKESLNLFTDRDLYISGETLLLKVFAPASEQSGIANIDLINRKGKKITGVILEIINHQADGFVYLPDSLSSGSYLLRTSTRTNKIQTCKEIYIANRFTGLPESNSDMKLSGVIPVNETSIQNLQVDGIEDQYKPRQKGHAMLQLPAALITQIDGDLSVSISGVTQEDKSRQFLQKSETEINQSIAKEGIIIEGIITDLKTAKPFKNAVVYLSIPDSIPGFQYYITEEDGHFIFQLGKYYGKIPVVIQCFAKEKASLLKININDRNNLSSEMPAYEPRAFSPEFRKSVAISTDAVTFRKIFNQQEIAIQPAPVVKRDAYPYYGDPTKTIDPQLFVELPDFNEISKELLPGVKFRNYNRIPTLQVFNAAQLYYFNDPPLLLLDGIPIRDLNVIKDMGTKDIDKVEICQNERFYGDLIFPGVVAIYTSKADYTRVPESNDLIKLSLEVIQPHAVVNAPSEQRLNEPDLRQVILWEPTLKPAPKMELDFQTSDIRGSYKLVVRGKNRDGSIIYKEQSFEVD
ncbi:MAG TPA: hypothetical protein VFC67_16255 [Prolixibacteraceae bacterium]|nr:hypothetical protein [Prolixibacteraceae bacterium]